MVPSPVIHILETEDYEADIAKGVAALGDGHLIVLPTETVYGAAGLLNHAGVLEQLKSLRNSADSKPFTIHIANREDALQYLGPINDYGLRLMKKLWPGPVGLIFDVPANRRAEVAAERDARAVVNLFLGDF